MKVVYARESFPPSVVSSIFLAGPTSRGDIPVSWRLEALATLADLGYQGDVYVPETNPDVTSTFDYESQVEWETEALNRADCILFWIPRSAELPGLTTNDEWGAWKGSGKVVLGTPAGAWSVRYQKLFAEQNKIPCLFTLRETLEAAVSFVTPGRLRYGGECHVPLHMWRAQSFRAWYLSQVHAGNSLRGAKVLWTYPPGKPFMWAMKADIYVAAENRYKSNEVVISRTDIASVLLYRKGATLMDTEIVLVKEFRSPVRNESGFVCELPSGSSKDTESATIEVALKEVEEEVGLRIDSSRIRVGHRKQVVSTFSTHKCSLFYAEVTEEEIAQVKANPEPRGEEGSSERTYPCVLTLGEASGILDWSMLGMVLQTLVEEVEF